MNKITHYISVFIVAILLFSSCQIESPHNDKLDGYWHIEQIDTIATGGHADLREARVTWSIQAHLLQIRNYDSDERQIYVFHFNSDGQTLQLIDAYFDDRTIGDSLITDYSQIQPYGVNTIPVVYTIESVSRERMVLSDGIIRISFRKM